MRPAPTKERLQERLILLEVSRHVAWFLVWRHQFGSGRGKFIGELGATVNLNRGRDLGLGVKAYYVTVKAPGQDGVQGFADRSCFLVRRSR